jgi:hypothetical protein
MRALQAHAFDPQALAKIDWGKAEKLFDDYYG